MEKLKKLEVYTDGASRGNPGLGAYAYAYLSVSNLTEEFSKAVENTTNNCMELTAILECLKKLKVYEFDYIDQVTINTDSQYSIDVITKWSNNWDPSEFENRPNGNIIKEIRRIRNEFYQSGIKVIFNKVKGHSDNQGNIRADELCNKAMDEYLSRDKLKLECPYCSNGYPIALSYIPRYGSITLKSSDGNTSSNYVLSVKIKDLKVDFPGNDIHYCPNCGRKLDN